MTDLARVIAVYQGSDGDATKRLYVELEAIGQVGVVAMNLFRACKCSERAKAYRKGRGYKTEAYNRKDWSIRNLADALSRDACGLRYGWAIDEGLRQREDPHHHIIYVDLPTGQVSFHVGTRSAGPDYHGNWDGVRDQAADRICRWVAQVITERVPA